MTGIVTLATDGDERIAALVLAGALLAMPIAYIAAMLLAPVVERRRMARLLHRSVDPEMDLAIVEHASARTVAATWAERWEGASLAAPLAAVALVGPLALHAILGLIGGDVQAIGGWIAFSALIVGHAHLVFAGLAVRYVNELRAGTLSTHPAFRMWGLVTLVSAVPGVLLIGLPPLITGVTGLFLVYPMCKWAEVALGRERLALAD